MITHGGPAVAHLRVWQATRATKYFFLIEFEQSPQTPDIPASTNVKSLMHVLRTVHEQMGEDQREVGLAYCVMRRTSTVLRSNSSKNGNDARPSYAGCWPASS